MAGAVVCAMQRANRTLDMIKSYADQGKEPPPELLQMLQPARTGSPTPTTAPAALSAPMRLDSGFLFARAGLAFRCLTFMAIGRQALAHDRPADLRRHHDGRRLALGFLVAMLRGRDRDDDGPA